jgi:biopolymer transport protein ExbD
MTPMIDVIFNVLVFLLLTPVLRGPEAYLTTNLPPGGQGPGSSVPGGVKVELVERGASVGEVEIVFDGRQVLPDFRALEAELKGLRARGLAPDYPILIAPTAGVRHKLGVRAFDAITAARFRKICFAVPGTRDERKGRMAS